MPQHLADLVFRDLSLPQHRRHLVPEAVGRDHGQVDRLPDTKRLEAGLHSLDGCVGAPIPPEHLLKLVGLRYIEVVDDCYEATSTGQFRIASGS